MTSFRPAIFPSVGCFRLKLLVAMMLVVAALTAAGLLLAQRNAAADVERDLRREFQADLAELHGVQEMRHAALAERCRALAQRPRIHAALEDNALDLLYLSARDELRDVMDNAAGSDLKTGVLHARFYRFLGADGAVIPPPDAADVGALRPEEEARLALPAVPDRQQTGYLLRNAGDAAAETVDEIIAVPIASTETGENIAAIVLGFKPFEPDGGRADADLRSGIWLEGRLHLPALGPSARAALGAEAVRTAAAPDRPSAVTVDGAPHLLFSKRLNPDSLFPPAFEVCVYPLTDLLARQRQLRWQILGAGALLLLAGLAASHFLAGRLSRPVERLAVDSAENLAGRERAEAELETTSAELQRAARFSADASHQLKTPVTVLRAGLEELLTQKNLSPAMCEEVHALVHQTRRLTGIVEDLLLLSRMDAGRLQLDFTAVNLSAMIEALLDDLSALPDGPELAVETDFPAALHVAGEQRYTVLILQNLLENARKYNRPGGRLRVAAREDGAWAVLTVGNTGRGIPAAAREHIFERFHRGAVGEDVPGHGLGLNLARELARLHRGDLRLARSDVEWTEFEVRFRLAASPASVPAAAPTTTLEPA